MESSSIEAVEKIVAYNFKDKSLLEEALTHSSYTEGPSLQRLEFFGDAALGLAVAKYLYEAYPEFNQGKLTNFRSAIVSTEMLARVAIHHDLFTYLHHTFEEFARVVREEGDEIRHSGVADAAPKVLADVVESILAALYIDSDYDLKKLWDCFRDLLRPLSVKTLREFHRLERKEVEITHQKKEGTDVGNIFVDIVETITAKEALENLCQSLSKVRIRTIGNDSNNVLTAEEIDSAKLNLNEFCTRKRWHKPTYRLEKEDGPSHERRFICSVQIDTKEGPYVASGDMKF
ncbi:hypothetical protein Scep_012827 [Stephania cephalantha]|uniref:Uncharacterized protein n=1 Tax=Stephania cephalantha TaxID=152367 RepID=A0AAP0P7Y9_9MAGN